MLEKCTPDVKLVFLCSPNNPTGNLLSEDSIISLTRALEGRAIVVVDEAYIEFSGAQSLARKIGDFRNSPSCARCPRHTHWRAHAAAR